MNVSFVHIFFGYINHSEVWVNTVSRSYQHMTFIRYYQWELILDGILMLATILTLRCRGRSIPRERGHCFDALAHCVFRSSVAIALTRKRKRVLVFHEEEFQLSVPSQGNGKCKIVFIFTQINSACKCSRMMFGQSTQPSLVKYGIEYRPLSKSSYCLSSSQRWHISSRKLRWWLNYIVIRLGTDRLYLYASSFPRHEH